MHYDRLSRHYFALPLRTKLTLWNTLVMLLLSVTALIGVREGLRWMLHKELAVALDDEVVEIGLSAEQPFESAAQVFEEMQRTAAGHLRHGWFLQLLDESGTTPLWSSRNTPDELTEHNPIPLEGSQIERDGFRFAQRHLDREGMPAYWVRVGTATDFIGEDIDNVTRIITPVLIFIFMLAPIGGYIVAGRATSPLQKIISTSRTLHPNQLDARLPLRGTDDELDQLSAEINEFLDQIASHLQRNREFVAHAAHELRSPLAAIEASVDVALSRRRSAEEYEDLLGTILEECRQLTVLVNQLLLLAESDGGGLSQSQQAIDLSRVTSSSVEMFRGVAEEVNIEIEARISPKVTVMGDSTRLRQVVNNLIDNAVKYTLDGGSVQVTLRENQAAGQAVLQVCDTGIGIPAEDLAHVFDRFYQVDRSRQRNQAIHGCGLGLSICRAIVEAYNGEIHVASQPGRGTTFTVTFPCVAHEVPKLESPAASLA